MFVIRIRVQSMCLYYLIKHIFKEYLFIGLLFSTGKKSEVKGGCRMKRKLETRSDHFQCAG